MRNEEYEREIDIIDLFWEWISHWRSAIVFLLIGCVLMTGLLIYNNAKNREAAPEVSAPLSAIDKLEIEKLAKQYKLNEEALDRLISSKDSIEEGEFATAISDYLESNDKIKTTQKALGDEGKNYFYQLIGINTETTNSSPSPFLFWIPFFSLLFHAILVCIIYVFDNRLKMSEKPGEILGNVYDFARVIDWEVIDNKKGIDHWVFVKRIGKCKKIVKKDMEDINAHNLYELIKNSNVNSLIVLNLGDENNGNSFVNCYKAIAGEGADIQYTDSIVYNNDACNSEKETGCVIITDSKKTTINSLLDEYSLLTARGIKVMGVMRY